MNQLPESISPWMEYPSYDWTPIIKESDIYEYGINQHLYHQSDKIDTVFLVISGRVRQYLISADGQEKALAIAGTNCLIGENKTVDSDVYFESAVAVSKVKAASLSYNKFESILYNFPNLIKQYIDLLNRKIRLASVYNLELSYGSSVYRIYDAFYHLALNYGRQMDSGITILLKFTHQELANLVGTSRVTVAKTVNEMLKNRIITKDGKYYHIPDIDKLLPGV
ncbi:Crp/Fnr family transcriptional regulator [Virgibacillus ihumii]|uniref:Crp/Fnr family transcriptional regulator n=1 Tax=Virgibacillus ihumii TaxID=2686091 RepID=UPI00157C5148|nr:Crp/Fnr family transcriptional regulator [Virgibacillus ihumii]